MIYIQKSDVATMFSLIFVYLFVLCVLCIVCPVYCVSLVLCVPCIVCPMFSVVLVCFILMCDFLKKMRIYLILSNHVL